MGEIVFLGLNLDAWITLITVITVLAVLLLTKVRTDAVFLIVTGVLFVTGVLDARETCSGFSSSAVVVTGVLTVVVTGLHETGVLLLGPGFATGRFFSTLNRIESRLNGSECPEYFLRATILRLASPRGKNTPFCPRRTE